MGSFRERQTGTSTEYVHLASFSTSHSHSPALNRISRAPASLRLLLTYSVRRTSYTRSRPKTKTKKRVSNGYVCLVNPGNVSWTVCFRRAQTPCAVAPTALDSLAFRSVPRVSGMSRTRFRTLCTYMPEARLAVKRGLLC